MISGKIRNREAVIPLDIVGAGQPPRQIEAVIDTGYNGSLTLPQYLVSALRLSFAGHRRGRLADGSVVLMDVFQAEVVWHGKSRLILASQADGTPLVGMSLLEGSRVVLDVVQDGQVTIEETGFNP